MNAWWKSPRGFAPLGDDLPPCRAYAPEASYRAGANKNSIEGTLRWIAAPHRVSTD
jgi:hypothetical protein